MFSLVSCCRSEVMDWMVWRVSGSSPSSAVALLLVLAVVVSVSIVAPTLLLEENA